MYAPGPRVPASCQRRRAACPGAGTTVRTPYTYQPRPCRTYHVPWHHRWEPAGHSLAHGGTGGMVRRLAAARAATHRPKRLARLLRANLWPGAEPLPRRCPREAAVGHGGTRLC
eukprot:scaffold82598_cov59-Phaeocystis_antarctica.AAC.5